MNFEYVKHRYLNDKSIKTVAKTMFKILDDMDVVDALKICKDLEHMFHKKLCETITEFDFTS